MICTVSTAGGLGYFFILRSRSATGGVLVLCGRRCAARCRVRFIRVGIVRIVGGVLNVGCISGARLYGLRTGGGSARVAFHVSIHMIKVVGKA